MRLFSYVVARDYGFAPNPFFHVCTLATCKPQIRRHAAVGDWVIGTGSASHGRSGHLVYAMEVSEAMTYTEYWNDNRFAKKRPILRASKKQAFGDNIYRRDDQNQWHQADSHHSFATGRPNIHNIQHDTGTDRVLIGHKYIYWGGSGPEIPQHLRQHGDFDICAGRNYKCKFPCDLVQRFLAWLTSLKAIGYCGRPTDWQAGRDGFPTYP